MKPCPGPGTAEFTAYTRRLSLLDPVYRREALREIRRIVPRLRNLPYVNLYTIQSPAIATVSGNFRLTADDASADIRHTLLDFGGAAFPVDLLDRTQTVEPGFGQGGVLAC